MSASNLFDDIEGDDDIFYTPAKTPPKKKKQWMDDLLDDDKDLFGDIKADNKDSSEPASAVAPSMEKKEGETTKPKSGGGLFDDLPLDDEDKPLSKSEGQASNINGHKDEEFVLVSHNEVPSAEEAERTANPAPATDTTEAEHDGPNSDLFNQNVGYEERARLRREQRRKRAEEKERNSKTPSPTSHSGDTSEDRDKRSTTPSPSPEIVETSQELPESRKSQSPVAELSVEPQEEKVESLTPTPEPTPQQKDDPSEEIWQLTKSLERAQAENGYLKSENEQLTGEVKTLQDKVAKLEKELADRTKKEDEDSAANKKQVADLQEKLKSKDKEIEDLKAALKKTASPHHGPVTTVVSLKKTPHSPAQSPRTKLRAGVDKGRPITSVADSVKKFSGAGTTEVKRTPVPAKPKQSSPAHVKPDDKHSPAKKPSATPHPKPSPPAKPRVPTHHDKPELHPSKHHAHSHTHQAHPPKDHAHSHGHHPHSHHPHPHHPHHPHKPEPSSKSVKVTHKKPQHTHHTHAHHTTDKKESAKQEKMEEEKKTEEVTITKEEPKPEPEPVAPPAEPEPPSEPKSEAPAAEVKPSEKKEEETTIQQLEKDTTRAQRVISLFENKGNNKPEEEQAPVWKVSAQQQRAAKDKEEREKEAARQKDQEQQQEEEKEKAEAEKSRTSSNASSQKDEPVVVNGSVESTTAESANDEKESTDGGMISKARGLVSSSSNVTKSTSALPPATKNTSNKNDEIKIRDNKIKKAGSSTTTIANPKKRLMVEETKGKRSSWAAPKREECAVCEKVVYVMERLEADKVVYHKTCFKCTVCNKTLSTGTYAALQGKIYCKVHFKQLFKMKGNYDEGFGREQHKTKWIKKDQLDGESEA